MSKLRNDEYTNSGQPVPCACGFYNRERHHSRVGGGQCEAYRLRFVLERKALDALRAWIDAKQQGKDSTEYSWQLVINGRLLLLQIAGAELLANDEHRPGALRVRETNDNGN